ncbi:uncharacterized protein MONOS_6246 [Monocercomonoides exilis]|uniref:uncharacterized protein n=1 Tax=Monocercomonoides exilis TaxID=2049356 RepID=UPI0035599FB2|nr:hypothetical protein MONOS_6246 [Monocercomonoides exilis]|eukprot:MONOS_6246.1-p1 / transcript=MONOS_6246.1 / gene=MONOS_6246 / organism=Monocercomonoides_exilis_PA203 / gene_product=unspecified product / transcript_product=unspecified product / location=Mono_scaffold00194:22275-22607(-) / protein_length=111 / sequence_SO=supercontig / SO=protein_coding / is_pseudo=false
MLQMYPDTRRLTSQLTYRVTHWKKAFCLHVSSLLHFGCVATLDKRLQGLLKIAILRKEKVQILALFEPSAHGVGIGLGVLRDLCTEQYSFLKLDDKRDILIKEDRLYFGC